MQSVRGLRGGAPTTLEGVAGLFAADMIQYPDVGA
jgi:hypothetical protein